MEIRDRIVSTHEELDLNEKQAFVEPKLAFVEPELQPQGDVAKVTAAFFGTFSP